MTQESGNVEILEIDMPEFTVKDTEHASVSTYLDILQVNQPSLIYCILDEYLE
jgi:hypothetical protein